MDVAEAADLLWAERQAGGRSPEGLRGQLTLDEAYRVQRVVADRLIAEGDRVSGWKIGGNSAGFRRMYDGHPPMRGFLFASTLYQSGQTIDHASFAAPPKLESELCFTLSRRLAGPTVTRAEVAEAVESVAPAYEIPFLNPNLLAAGKMDIPLCIADNANNMSYVAGRAIRFEPERFDFETIHVDERRNGEPSQQGHVLDFIDHQFDSIAWLARHLDEYGLAIEADHCIMSGNCCPRPANVSPGDRWETTFTGLGSVSINFD